MKSLFIFTFLVTTTLSCSAQSTKTPEPEKNKSPAPVSGVLKQKAKDCICVQVYMPVCGSDQKTYSNACMAQCAGVTFTQGECAEKN